MYNFEKVKENKKIRAIATHGNDLIIDFYGFLNKKFVKFIGGAFLYERFLKSPNPEMFYKINVKMKYNLPKFPGMKKASYKKAIERNQKMASSRTQEEQNFGE